MYKDFHQFITKIYPKFLHIKFKKVAMIIKAIHMNYAKFIHPSFPHMNLLHLPAIIIKFKNLYT